MKYLMFLPLALLFGCKPEKPQANQADSAAAVAPVSAIDFSWRQRAGDFPKDKPAYLILTTEDAVTYSKMLPEFVKQKEAMGFHVYVATEKDYGTGKTGNAQAEQVRAWLCEFQKRTGGKYALLIGSSHPSSDNLPSPTTPDGEHGGMDAAYCDIDGKWVDLYLNTTEKDTRSAWTQMCAGSILVRKALTAGGPRKDELIVGRISYAGTEIGNSAYDLDRILEKTIRYERDTVAGKGLDWRARALSVITNYGGANWDDGLIRSVEKAGGTLVWRSHLGISGAYVPENIFDGAGANRELLNRTERAGMVCTMSHGWNRGCEGVINQPNILTDIDDRWPSSIGVAACTGFHLSDQCNLGQSWLRKGAIFACGTAVSANNGARVPLQTNQLDKRVSVGEAVANTVVQYGDPSLHVLPPAGTPVTALQIQPSLAGHYEERTLDPRQSPAEVKVAYTLTNRSAETLQVTATCDAAWIALSNEQLTLKPGAAVTLTATSTSRLQKMAPGNHIARIRFTRGDGQLDQRRIAVKLEPVSLQMAFSFDTLVEKNRFADVAMAQQPKGAWHDNTSLWLITTQKGPHWNPFVKVVGPIAGMAAEPEGKVGGGLRINHPKASFKRGLAGFTKWRGSSVSLWFKTDALPEPKKKAVILAAPFELSIDAAGVVAAGKGGKPANLGTIQPGTWHFVQVRSDVANNSLHARLDGLTEVATDAKIPTSDSLVLGSFNGVLDEIKVWSGELGDAELSAE
ncbi:MAG TPA: C25 family cysteine peptidase, partial [Luteolibacter sp.]